MTAFTHHNPESDWQTQRREPPVHVYLAAADGGAASLVGVRLRGIPVELNLSPVTDWIDPDELAYAAAAVIQVDADTPASIKRFEKLAAICTTPLIAASYEPPLALVRTLLRNGATDVIALPLDAAELETCLGQIEHSAAVDTPQVARPTLGRVVSFVKTSGGAGTTALLCQAAARFAAREMAAGRGACLLDFDVQFGDAAFQMGLNPGLSVSELLDAGSRLDGDLVRSTASRHASGLHVVAAPGEIMPLDSHSSDEFIHAAEVAAREFGTAFLQLPTNWTNWSLSLLARSDLILIVAELTVGSIHRAKRQLDLLRSQQLGDLNIMVVVNKFDKSQLRLISRADVRAALGLEVAVVVTDDSAVVRVATERGVTIDQVKRRSAVAKDIDNLDAAIAASLKLER